MNQQDHMFPVPDGIFTATPTGTDQLDQLVRTDLATNAMRELIAKAHATSNQDIIDQIADTAVRYADAVIARLKEPTPKNKVT